MKTLFFTSVCAVLTFGGVSAREFTDTHGRKLDAEVVSVSGGQVTLQRTADNRIFTLASTTFTEEDQKFIAEWATANTKYSFDITYTKKKINEVKSKNGPIVSRDETWIYKINVRNLQPTAVGDLRVDYWCFRRADEGKGKGIARIETSGSINVPTILGSSTVTLDSNEIPLHKEQLTGKFYYPSGANEVQADGMGGLAVRIFDKMGKEVHQWATKDDLLAAAVGKTMPKGSKSEEETSSAK